MQQNFKKMISLFWITSFELVEEIYLIYDKNPFDPAVNVLLKSPKISILTRRDVFQLNLS